MTQRTRAFSYFALATLFALMIPLLIACGPQAASPTTAPAAATTAPPAATTAAATTAPTRPAAVSPAATSPAAAASPARAASPRAASPVAAASPAAAADGYPSGGQFSTLEPVGRTGGRIIEISFADARTTNPMLSSDTASGARIAMMFNALIDVSPDTGLPFADLATFVPTLENGGISKDGLTYTFKLRTDVKWHDGQPFTARDVVFTYTTMMQPELGSPRTAELTERVESVTAPDDYTVVMKLKKVVAPFLLDQGVYGIVPEHVLRDVPVADIRAQPFSTGAPPEQPNGTIGTGPFKFKEWVKDDHATLVKNPDFFRGEPALDEYVFKVVRDQAVVVAQLKTGEADYGGIQKSFWEEMQRQPNVNTLAYDTYSFTFYAYQLDPAKTTLFQEQEVRQALLYGLDREAMMDAIFFGLGTVAPGTMPVLSWAYAPDQITTTYDYNPRRATEMLDQAGWRVGPDGVRTKDGQRLAFTLWTNAGNKEREQYVTVMQQQWQAIGVEATPRTEEWNAYLQRITETKDFEIFLVGFAWGVDPDQTTMWACDSYTGGFNMNKYCNERVDELLAQGLSELDQERRRQLYIEMQNIIMEELPSVILGFPQSTVAVNKRVHNLLPNAINVRWNAHTWWVEDGR